MKLQRLFLLLIFFTVPASAQYSLQDVFPTLQDFTKPTDALIIRDGSNRILVLEQRGRIWIFDPQSPAQARLFWDGGNVVSPDGCETGLLGCAFHPDFIHNHYIFLSYTTGANPQWTSHIVRYECSTAAPDAIIPSTAHDILTITQPFGLCNHKGGCLQFGPDGYLYASFGDGGSGGDPNGNGQNRSVLFGKILRLDVDHEADGNHYAIPSNNPFANNTEGFRKEIYAYGLRNTWKFSFDNLTGKLWAGDVGQNAYEEIDTIVNGGNYGWNIMEGFHCYPSGDFNCDSTGLIAPIWEYDHSMDGAITGGFVYRGNILPEMIGKYIYGDYVSGRIWALTTGNGHVTNQLLTSHSSLSLSLSSFAEDQNHEIYAIGYDRGRLYKLVSNAGIEKNSTKEIFSLTSDRTLLDQLHPNAEIQFTLPVNERISLVLVNAAGQEIQRLVNNEELTGKHTIQSNIRSLTNGLYFIKLSANSGTLVQKIVVMK